jgi:lysophospholipase L1-like esterase
MMMSTSRSRVALWFGVLLLTGAVVEGASYVAGTILQGRAILYLPQPVSEAEFRDYVAGRDPTLGWPSHRDLDSVDYDARGARTTEGRESADVADCIAVFGDSFTFGAEVEPEDSWPSQLGDRLGCPVANFGVSGYGTDQALLRFLEKRDHLPPVVLMGHFQEGMLRNVNQFHGLLNGGEGLGFKPRFILDDRDELELVPLPDLSYAQYQRAIRDPGGSLPHEYFSPGGQSGLQSFQFPYTLSVLGTMGHFSIRARLADLPRHAAFYDPDHASRSLEITTRLLASFHEEASALGFAPVIIMLPASRDLELFAKEERWVFEPLTRRLQQRSISIANVGSALAAHTSQPGAAVIFASGGHYNALGNRIVAEAIHAHLRDQGLFEGVATR